MDDDPAVRDSLETLLEAAGLNVSSFASAEEFLADYRAAGSGCLVLDVKMPGMSGLDLQDELALREARIPIIFITGHGDVAMSVKALQSGAVDFLEKPFDNQQLLDRIHEGIAADQMRRERDATAAGLARLTPRERVITEQVVAGRSSREIAQVLDISRRTVETHRARILAKLGAKSVSEMVAIAVESGLYRRKPHLDDEDAAPSAG